MNPLTAEELHNWLRSRHSVRDFEPRPVPEDVLRRILETGIHAPNAHNRQAWRFVVLTKEVDRLKLAESMASAFEAAMRADGMDAETIAAKQANTRRRLKAAPAVILLFCLPGKMDAFKDAARQAGEAQMAAQSLALAGGQMLLAAHAEGLGGVWVCWPLFTPEAVNQAFDLPAEWLPQGMLLLGYPAGEPRIRERLPLDNVVAFK